MIRLLRSLEKKLVVERTEIAVVPLVHDLLSRWEEALSDDRPVPDVLDFVARLIQSGFCLTTGSKAFAYLDECWRKGSLPVEGRLLQILMPWYVPGQPVCSSTLVTRDPAALIANEENPPGPLGRRSPSLAVGVTHPRVRRAAHFVRVRAPSAKQPLGRPVGTSAPAAHRERGKSARHLDRRSPGPGGWCDASTGPKGGALRGGAGSLP